MTHPFRDDDAAAWKRQSEAQDAVIQELQKALARKKFWDRVFSDETAGRICTVLAIGVATVIAWGVANAVYQTSVHKAGATYCYLKDNDEASNLKLIGYREWKSDITLGYFNNTNEAWGAAAMLACPIGEAP